MNAAADMQIGSQEWTAMLSEGAARMGLTVRPAQAAQFATHARLLLEWNRKINLTAITDPTQVAVKHYLDAIAPLDHIPPGGRLLDIGTGGGFPGIPLKVMRPDQPMTLIDGVRKKVNFVKHVIRALRLNRIEALHTRASEKRRSAQHGFRGDRLPRIGRPGCGDSTGPPAAGGKGLPPSLSRTTGSSSTCRQPVQRIDKRAPLSSAAADPHLQTAISRR